MTDPTIPLPEPPPMPPTAVQTTLGDLLYSNDADRIERAAIAAQVEAKCAPLVRWLRAGGRLAVADAEELAWALACELAERNGHPLGDESRDTFRATFLAQHNHDEE